MSRVANSPVNVPSGVDVALDGQQVTVKGGKGTLQFTIHNSVEVKQDDNVLTFVARDGAKQSRANYWVLVIVQRQRVRALILRWVFRTL